MRNIILIIVFCILLITCADTNGNYRKEKEKAFEAYINIVNSGVFTEENLKMHGFINQLNKEYSFFGSKLITLKIGSIPSLCYYRYNIDNLENEIFSMLKLKNIKLQDGLLSSNGITYQIQVTQKLKLSMTLNGYEIFFDAQ